MSNKDLQGSTCKANKVALGELWGSFGGALAVDAPRLPCAVG